MLKADLRAEYKQRRLAISDKQRVAWNDLLLIQFQQLDCSGVETILSYAPMAKWKEFDPVYWVEYLQFGCPELKVAFPVVDMAATPRIQAVQVDADTEWKMHPWGMAEPVSEVVIPPQHIDMVLVPLLAFDRRGYRVGYGKGFYDEFLPYTREDCAWVGISYFPPLPDLISDVHTQDLPLDLVITPEEIFTFR